MSMPAARPPGRDLLVFCDGTSNTLTAGRRDTHVLRLYEHVAAQRPAPDGRERVLYYDPGVGAPDAVPPTDPSDLVRRLWGRIAGLASGRGIYDNIGQAYRFLMQHWRGPQDRIFVFGFSRGAFTARAVAGMVNRFGLLAPQHEGLLPTLLAVYFARGADGRPWTLRLLYRLQAALLGEPTDRQGLAEQIRHGFASTEGALAEVHFVGLWDTVESVGLSVGLGQRFTGTPGLRGKRIRHVRQALALDEHRLAFTPQLYEEPGDIDEPDQTLRQRWFAGAHTDIGGGQPAAEAGLADDTLDWMVAELGPQLALPPAPRRGGERVRHDMLYATPWWALVGMTLRDAGAVKVLRAAVPAPARDVWQRRRPLLPLVVAALGALVFWWLSGLCLQPQEDPWSLEAFGQALAAASGFADRQLAALWGAGLLAEETVPWHLQGHPAWAMFFDLLFIACWGYLLARLASRAFSWLVAGRGPDGAHPRWLWLGLAPMVAVFGDIAEDLLTCIALALQGASAAPLVTATLHGVGLASVAKIAGLGACLPLAVVRYWLAFEPRTAFGAARRRAGHLYALLLPAALLLAVWGLARGLVCWGGTGPLGDMFCRGHYAIGALLAGSAGVVWWLRRDLLAQAGERRSAWQGFKALEQAERRHVGWSGALTLALLLLCLYLLLLSPIRF